MIVNSKRILFIAPNFNSYHNKIIKEFRSQGYDVLFVQEKITGWFWDLICKINPVIYKAMQKKLLLWRLNKCGDKNYSHLIVVRGEFVDESVIQFINEKFVIEKFISYQWDSVRNNIQSLNHHNNGFKVYSFDKFDCKQYGFVYLPLFFAEKYTTQIEREYDLSFVGVYTPERAKLISEIDAVLSGHYKLYFKLKINPIIYVMLRLFSNDISGLSRSFFTFKGFSYFQAMSVMRRSKVVLDISHSSQSGLTMRTMEAVGCNKKLLTNNIYIKDERFYSANFVCLYDSSCINDLKANIDSFIDGDALYSARDSYSLCSWIKSLMSV